MLPGHGVPVTISSELLQKILASPKTFLKKIIENKDDFFKNYQDFLKKLVISRKR
jgi:hypothetical protein